jgi:hypothetical protein
MLNTLLDHDIFSDGPRRPKDWDTWWTAMNQEQKDSVIETWVYAIASVKEQIGEMISIAEGTDLLNEQPDQETF